MNRPLGKLAVAAAGALLLAGCAGGGTAPGQAPSSGAVASQGSTTQGGAVLKTGQTPFGTVVVNGQGMTAYVFDKDTANSGTSACTGACVSFWPPIKTATNTPQVSGVTGKVGAIMLPGGTKQVTLNGLPLYTYAADSKAGDATGQGSHGFGAGWWVVQPDGTKLTSAPAATPSPYSGQGY
ncbi:COG4315 family predicted lipoprotein [Arthrobacter dokdonensis]|uniref:COG4315 family predicted lipoprotein n=1 Tax=Arthrobacter dokdonellae TaxID=2211210 RepID=UPI000DE5A016|nr:hypothetical protein [Arthrobacter dokdonellae]